MNKRYTGNGHLLFDGREIPVEYDIQSRRSPHRIEVTGTVMGLEGKDHVALVDYGKVLPLRLQSGEEVQIAFFGGDLGTPLSIRVNSPMP
jgi:hypothetical protein